MISDKTAVQDLLHLLKAHGVHDVVISPGSRNAPLSISFAEDDDIRTHVVVDERAAGYFALGIAQKTRKPVAVCCTSGSAAINYGPAVTEAYFQRLPLVVLSADRPREYVDQGDGQTIKQEGLFGDHVVASISLQEDLGDEDIRWFNARRINETLARCVHPVHRPVHINVPLRENLYGRSESAATPARTITIGKTRSVLGDAEANELEEKLSRSCRIMLLTGMLPPSDKLSEVVEKLIDKRGVLHLSETSSNLAGQTSITTIDRLIMPMNDREINELRPDLLITVGTNIISKKVKAALRLMQPDEHWHIDPSGEFIDTYKSLTKVITMSEVDFLQWLSEKKTDSSEYRDTWLAKGTIHKNLHDQYISKLGWNDFKAFSKILPALPKNSVFQMGNSSVVRYVQLFENRTDIRYFGNRGTSGIDGCTSTAMGFATVSDERVTLVSGDLSFFYDNNGLWQKEQPDNLRIIVINNGGGNIFKIIEGPSRSGFVEEVFEVPPSIDPADMAKTYGIDHRRATNESELAEGLDWLNDHQKCAILEVDTRGQDNATKVREYFRFIKTNQ